MGWIVYKCFVMLLLCQPGCGRELYVSHDGGDSESCGSSKASACKTIDYAIGLSIKNDVVQIVGSSKPYYVNSATGGPVNIDHTLHLRSASQKVTISCVNGTSMFRVSTPGAYNTSDVVTLYLEGLALQNCAISDADRRTLARPLPAIEIVNGSLNIRSSNFTNNGILFHHPQLGRHTCDFVGLVISNATFTANGVPKPYQQAIDIAGCNNVNITIQQSNFEWTPMAFKAEENLHVMMSGCDVNGQNLRARSIDITLGGRNNSISLSDCVIRGHQYSSTSPVYISLNRPTKVTPSVHLNRVIFKSNTATKHYGGALSLFSRFSHKPLPIKATLTDCRFVNNSATKGAGALYIEGVKNVDLVRCDFTSNSAVLGGAVIVVKAEHVVFANTSFKGNIATRGFGDWYGQGGAIHSSHSDITIRSSIFENNTAVINGQAIHIMAAENTHVQQCTFQNSIRGDLRPKSEVYIRQSDEGCRRTRGSFHFSGITFRIDECSNNSGIYHIESDDIAEFQNIQLHCPDGQHVKRLSQKDEPVWQPDAISTVKLAWCVSCPVGTFSLNGRSIALDPRYEPDQECQPCPPYASCPGSGLVRPIDNYWGHVLTEDNSMSFQLCPQDFCISDICSGLECCSMGRSGDLCGACREGYNFDVSAERCIAQSECKYSFRFLVMYTVGWSVVYVLVLLAGAALCEAIDHISYEAPAADIPVQRLEEIPDNASDQSSFEPSIDYTRSFDSHGLVAVIDETQILEGLENTPKAPGEEHQNLVKDAPLVICAWIMLVQLTDQYYIPWYGSSDVRHAVLGGLNDLINLRPLFVFLHEPCVSGSLASASQLVFDIICVAGMYAVVGVLVIVLNIILSVMEKARRLDLVYQRGNMNAVLCRVTLLLLTLTYVPLLKCLFRLIHCVSDNGHSSPILFMNGTIACNTWWHWLVVSVVIVTFSPLGLAIWMGLQLVKSDNANTPCFLLGLVFSLPAAIMWELRYGKHLCHCLLPYEYVYARMQLQSVELIQDASRTELDVISFFNWPFEKPSKDGKRRRSDGSKPASAWIIYMFMRAFILATFSVLLSHEPVTRNMVVIGCLIVAMALHASYRPYSGHVANHLEWILLGILAIQAVLGVHNAVYYTAGLRPYSRSMDLVKAFDWAHVALVSVALTQLLVVTAVYAVKAFKDRRRQAD